MKNYKTTIIGAILAFLLAIQPVLDGTGYKMDSETLAKLMTAGMIALLGYLSKDHDVI
jgi:uncharacterized membrane protein